ncbi:hypothetical protein NKH23_33685 [Mesorhizobium sp. M1328]|uniref:hypothetical protein n=1 Tax=Mesorhizobium sp. M1328 TaxID=2957082 RepID=UPI00333A8B3A
MTDVQVPPLALHIRRTSVSTADLIGGPQLMSKAIVSNHEWVVLAAQPVLLGSA